MAVNKVIEVLVYAFLEWILIILLLLNAFFTYLITRFAKYFGLSPPCLWCSRLDHFLDETSNSYMHLFCSSHATLISRLETNSQCQESTGARSRLAVISWVTKEDDRPTCSSCNQRLTTTHLKESLFIEEEELDDDKHGTEVKDGDEEHQLLPLAAAGGGNQQNETFASFSHSNVVGKLALVLEKDADLQIEEVDDDPENEIYDVKADQTPKATSKLQEQGSAPLINLPEDSPSSTGMPGPKHNEEENTSAADKKHHVSTWSWSNEPEEEKRIPETPTSVVSIHNLQKKLSPFEKRESAADELIDGSTGSEMEFGGDPVSVVERLKTALISERKTLTALYAELEEERSASAIAANQTMAMINRLQEEKAAVKMEALQYQRMMEEQAEYDQEALQLLNQLMIKREKEKKEVEKELEVYRVKVLEYEAKERMRTRSKNGSLRSRNSSTSFSNAGDMDELSIDLNCEARDEDSSMYGINTPGEEAINLQEIALDCVKQISALDNSLEEFEEERHSILDQLKALEEKLLSLGENEATTEDSTSKGLIFQDDYEFATGVGIGEGDDNPNERFPERRTMDSMAKTLLPFLDAAEDETEEMKIEEDTHSEFAEMQTSLELDAKRVAMENEVDHVYERLQALEADGEFLKHCMNSIQKGDKGIDLLQEILQHLSDLRAAELQVRSTSEDPME